MSKKRRYQTHKINKEIKDEVPRTIKNKDGGSSRGGPNTQNIICKNTQERDCINNIVVNTPVQDNSKELAEMRRANKISLGSAIFNGLLLVTTIAVFLQTTENILVAKKSLQASVQQFEISNRPYIEVSKFTVKNAVPDSLIDTQWELANLQGYPCLIEKYAYASKFDSIPPKETDTIPTEFFPFNQYLYRERVVVMQQTFPKHISHSIYEGLKNGTINLYFTGEVHFKDLVTGKRGVYNFLFQHNPYKQEYPHLLVSENKYNTDSTKLND